MTFSFCKQAVRYNRFKLTPIKCTFSPLNDKTEEKNKNKEEDTQMAISGNEIKIQAPRKEKENLNVKDEKKHSNSIKMNVDGKVNRSEGLKSALVGR